MHLFSQVDLFKQPVQLNINKNKNISTHFGKLLTLFMIFYIFYTLFGSNLVLRRNPTVKVENLRPLTRPPIQFNNSNFTFAVGLYDLNLGYIVDPTIFSYSAGLYITDNLNNTSRNIDLEIKICEEGDFINGGDNIKKTSTANLFCFKFTNETIDVYGAVDERMMKFLYLELNKCKNTSENNFTCKSPEEQENFLQGKFQDIIVQNDAIDYSDYLHPIKKDVIKHYVQLDVSFLKIVKTYIKHISFFSDDGFFFEDVKNRNSYNVESIIYDFQSNKFDDNQALLRIEMYSDNQETIHSRKYQHIQDLLAEMGGVLNIFILVGILIINIEIPYMMTKKISSELYTYNIEKNEKEKDEIPGEKEESKKQFSEITKSPNLTDFSPTDVKSIVKKMTILKNEHLNDSVDLPFSSFSKSKENEINPKLLSQDNLINSKICRQDSFFTVKIPILRGDEDTVYEKSLEAEHANDNIRVQRGNGFSSANTSKIIKTNSTISNKKKKISLMQTAFKFSIDFKNKLNFRRLLAHNAKRGKKNFPINFLSYLSILFKCKRFKLNQKEKLFLLGEQQIKKDLDIFKIINCMNDVEKLKMILLNDQQRYLFNLLQKPIITTKHISQELDKNALIVDGSKNRVKRSIIETFYKDLIANTTKSDIDKRILLLVDKNLVNVNEIQFNEHG